MVNFNSSINIPFQPAEQSESHDATVNPSAPSPVSRTASKISSIQETQFKEQEPKFYEVIRRSLGKNEEEKNERLNQLNEQLNQVTEEHLASLRSVLKKPSRLFHPGSFLRNDMFPYTALKALRNREITVHEFGTLMRLWSIRDAHMPDGSVPATPRFVPLFQDDGSRNPEAEKLLHESSQPPPKLPYLTTGSFLGNPIEHIYSMIKNQNPLEQGLWVVQDTTDFSEYHEEMLPEEGQQSMYDHHTIPQIIRNQAGLNWLSRISDDTAAELNQEIASAIVRGGKFRMVPSFGIQQELLKSSLLNPVDINPVIGQSTVDDIRSGSKLGHRDIALPFPGSELPEKADGFATPSPLDFIEHDFYHAIRASQISESETVRYIAAGDQLRAMQQQFNHALRELNQRHKKHKEHLSQLKQYVSTLPNEKKEPVLKAVFEKYKQEAELLAKMKRMRKSSGMLKFRLYDMEHAAHGGLLDPLIKPRLAFLMYNIFVHSTFIEQLPWGTDFGAKFGEIIARQTLEAMKPSKQELSEIRATQLHILQVPDEELRQSGMKNPQKGKSFWKGILEMTPQ